MTSIASLLRPARGATEDFEAYRIRRRAGNKAVRTWCRGTLTYPSLRVRELPANAGIVHTVAESITYRNVDGTYEAQVHRGRIINSAPEKLDEVLPQVSDAQEEGGLQQEVAE